MTSSPATRGSENGGASLFALVASTFPRLVSAGELAEFYRVQEVLGRAGLSVETDRGLSDEGDPWFVFCRAEDGEVVVHFARLDGTYVVAGPGYNCVARGGDFTSLVRDLVTRHPLVQPARREEGNVVLHPSALLIALVAAALLKAGEGRAETPDVASDGADRARAAALASTLPATHDAGGTVVMEARHVAVALSAVALALATAPDAEGEADLGRFPQLSQKGQDTEHDGSQIESRASGDTSKKDVSGGADGTNAPTKVVVPVQEAALSHALSLIAVLTDLAEPMDFSAALPLSLKPVPIAANPEDLVVGQPRGANRVSPTNPTDQESGRDDSAAAESASKPEGASTTKLDAEHRVDANQALETPAPADTKVVVSLARASGELPNVETVTVVAEAASVPPAAGASGHIIDTLNAVLGQQHDAAVRITVEAVSAKEVLSISALAADKADKKLALAADKIDKNLGEDGAPNGSTGLADDLPVAVVTTGKSHENPPDMPLLRALGASKLDESTAASFLATDDTKGTKGTAVSLDPAVGSAAEPVTSEPSLDDGGLIITPTADDQIAPAAGIDTPTLEIDQADSLEGGSTEVVSKEEVVQAVDRFLELTTSHDMLATADDIIFYDVDAVKLDGSSLQTVVWEFADGSSISLVGRTADLAAVFA